MSYPWEQQPTMRRPMQADDAYEGDVYDDDVHYTTRIPARARYIPLAQRDTLPPPIAARQVFVVDRRQRRDGGSRGGKRAPHPAASAPQRQQVRRLPPPEARQTQDDPLLYQQEAPQEAPLPPRHRRHHWHGTLYVGLGMFAMLVLWYLGLTVLSWWQVSQDDLHYGRPRTFQTDAVVGHHDSPSNPSHFIALNLHGQVEIIEFPGGDASHAKVYLGPMLAGGSGQDLTPVTLSFRDVNGDGKPDMLITIAGSQVVFLNDSGQFRPLKPGEHVHL